jgi:hypothetical protein
MRRNIFFFILIAAISLSGCKKILNVVSPNAVEDGNVFSTAAGVRNARIGLYSSLQNKNYWGAYFPLLAEGYSDNGTTGGYDVIDLNEIAAKSLSTTNLYAQNIYQAIYSTIYTANKIIENVDGKTIAGLASGEQNTILGEAYFVRGMSEFDLLRLYGEHWDKTSAFGISIVLTAKDSKTAVKRSTVAESYSAINTDLQKALSLITVNNGRQYISPAAANALLARLYLYSGDFTQAATYATKVIDEPDFALFTPANFTRIYSEKLTAESIFELKFDQQNQSTYNTATYSRDAALRSDVQFLASADLNTFFESRPADKRSALVNFTDNDLSIQPDGRTQKYRGETTKDNSGYIIRLAEVYLIRAESRGRTNGLADLNKIRTSRGLAALTLSDVPDSDDYLNAILDERRAELNFEGHRLFDLARTGKLASVLGATVIPILPIPQREIAATNGVVVQNPGY